MKNLLLFLSWTLFIPCSQAQSNKPPMPTSGYLYKIEPGTPGKVIYVCGQRPFGSNGDLVATGDTDGQLRQVFENLKGSLATVGMTLTDVAQITYIIKSSSAKASADTTLLLGTIGALYFTSLPKLIDVKNTPKIVHDDVLVEVEVITVK